jgi:hypothetical protein
MGAKQSAEVTRALKLVANGMTPYAAANKVGIALSTVYRARDREKRITDAVSAQLAELPESLIAADIEFSGLSIRARNALLSAGFRTASQVRSETEDSHSFSRFNNIGKITRREILIWCGQPDPDTVYSERAIGNATLILKRAGYDVRKKD